MSHTEERLRDENSLNEEIRSTIREIFDLDNNIERDTLTIKEKIKRLAGQYEELYKHRGLTEQVSEISSNICRMWDKQGKSHLKVYTIQVLDSKYKRVKSEQSTSHLLSSLNDVPEECSTMQETYNESANALLEAKTGYLTRDGLRDLYFKSISAADRFKEICEQNSIALPTKEHFDDSSDDTKDEKIKQEKPISSMTPEERAKLPYVQSVAKVVADIEAFRLALIDYPVELSDPLAVEIKSAFDSFHLVLQHSSDKKFRRTLLQWNDILYEAAEQGGTSAASHSGVQCAGLTDQKTGGALFRNITKEQIDAIKLPMYNKMNKIIHGLPVLGKMFVSMDEHFRKYEAPWRERRCALLSPKLQKKA